MRFVQDKSTAERGLFDEEMPSQELTQFKMGKIVKEKYPDLDSEDQEAIRQHAIASINLTQKGKENSSSKRSDNNLENNQISNTALLDIRKFVTDVSDLNVDLIDSINPLGGIFDSCKKHDEDNLKQIHSIVSSKKRQWTFKKLEN